ncbi:MAG: hypothetical protein HY904_00920 [Deltaproteobacteria bacterium]|nr:hypothetical protein [Deltaproteobacteria bacterium]
MWAWFYEGHDLLVLPVVAMIIFMVIFTAAVVRALRRGPHGLDVEHLSMLPLNDQSGTVAATGGQRSGG